MNLLSTTAMLLLLAAPSAGADVTKDLPYPAGTPAPADIAAQVYFVNHFLAVRNIGFAKENGHRVLLIRRTPGETPDTVIAERYLNNDYPRGETRSKDLAIFRSGQVKGTGILITNYRDETRRPGVLLWLPTLRKIRRVMTPAQDEIWPGTDLTYGDIYLRRPEDESHVLLGRAQFDDCLGTMEVPPEQRGRHLRGLPAAQCDHRGRQVYKLKSTTRFPHWWYDYRISDVDAETFADYRSTFFKDGQAIKVIDRDWTSLGLADPRAQVPRYLYARTFANGHETLMVVPQEVITVNADVDPSFWSEQTLRRIRR